MNVPAEPERDPTDPGPGASRGGVDIPARWQGGRLDGTEPALTPDFYDQAAHGDQAIHELDTDWGALEPLEEGDAPEEEGFDLASLPGAGGRARRPTEVRTGVIKVISKTRTGVLLEEVDIWFNTSKYHPGVTLDGFAAGDVVRLEAETGTNGGRYLRRIEVVDQAGEPGHD